MVLTESWLHEGIPDSLLELDGYTLVRADRSSDSGKKSGGGVCMYICDRWCKQYTVRDKVCTPDIELLCVSLRPHYLPREFGCVIICAWTSHLAAMQVKLQRASPSVHMSSFSAHPEPLFSFWAILIIAS